MDVAWHNKGSSFYFPSIQSKLKEKVSIFFSSSLRLTGNNGFIISTLKVLLGCPSHLFILPSSLLSVFWGLQIYFLTLVTSELWISSQPCLPSQLF